MTNVSLDALRDAIATVDFPADKDQLLAAAQQAGAGDAVQQALRSMPPAVAYDNAEEVIRSVHVDVGSPPTAAQRSDPESGHDHDRVADRLQ